MLLYSKCLTKYINRNKILNNGIFMSMLQALHTDAERQINTWSVSLIYFLHHQLALLPYYA